MRKKKWRTISLHGAPIWHAAHYMQTAHSKMGKFIKLSWMLLASLTSVHDKKCIGKKMRQTEHWMLKHWEIKAIRSFSKSSCALLTSAGNKCKCKCFSFLVWNSKNSHSNEFQRDQINPKHDSLLKLCDAYSHFYTLLR